MPGIVRDDDERLSIGMQIPNNAMISRGRAAVEIAGRLVGQQQLRSPNQRTSDGDALALAARKLIGFVLQAIAQADARQGVVAPLPA